MNGGWLSACVLVSAEAGTDLSRTYMSYDACSAALLAGAVDLDLRVGRARRGLVERAAAVGPELGHEAEGRVAGVLAGDQAVARDPELVVDLLGVFDHVVPGGRRLLGIEPGSLEHVRVPDERHRLVVGRDAVGLALPHVTDFMAPGQKSSVA